MPLSTPVAWLNMEDLTDSGPNGFSFSNTNSVDFSGVGKIGNCGAFASASSKRLECADAAALRLVGGDFSITAFIRITSFNAWAGLIGKGTSAQGWCVFFHSTDANKLYFYVGSSVVTMPLSVTLSTGTWYSIMLVRSGTTLKCYIDNAEVGSQGASGTTTGTQTLYVGFANGDGSYFNGDIDLLGIYDYAIDSTERSTLYNSGAGYDPTTPVGGGVARRKVGGCLAHRSSLRGALVR